MSTPNDKMPVNASKVQNMQFKNPAEVLKYLSDTISDKIFRKKEKLTKDEFCKVYQAWFTSLFDTFKKNISEKFYYGDKPSVDVFACRFEGDELCVYFSTKLDKDLKLSSENVILNKMAEKSRKYTTQGIINLNDAVNQKIITKEFAQALQERSGSDGKKVETCHIWRIKQNDLFKQIFTLNNFSNYDLYPYLKPMAKARTVLNSIGEEDPTYRAQQLGFIDLESPQEKAAKAQKSDSDWNFAKKFYRSFTSDEIFYEGVIKEQIALLLLNNAYNLSELLKDKPKESVDFDTGDRKAEVEKDTNSASELPLPQDLIPIVELLSSKTDTSTLSQTDFTDRLVKAQFEAFDWSKAIATQMLRQIEIQRNKGNLQQKSHSTSPDEHPSKTEAASNKPEKPRDKDDRKLK